MNQSQPNPPRPSEAALNAALQMWQSAGRRHTIPIEGSSMLPLLRHGDRVTVTHGLDGLRRGDVIVFRRGDRLVAHRLLKTGRQTFITKGDHTLHLDAPVPAAAVLGRVVGVQRGARLAPLDTPAWRRAGALIAALSAGAARVARWGRRVGGGRGIGGKMVLFGVVQMLKIAGFLFRWTQK